MKLGSTVRQSVDLENSQKLLTAIQRIAEIFWATKGVETRKISSNYPSGGDLVVPV
jgi:nickel superoxide dismutase